MSDKKRDFHDIALHSSLFKGRNDWYFCFLKSERLAHVLAVLADKAPEGSADDFYTLRERAAMLPSSVVEMICDARGLREVLADVFSLLAQVRLFATRNLLTKETAAILIEEYQALAEKLDASSRVSPFVAASDFAIPLSSPELSAPTVADMLPRMALPGNVAVKDTIISKGHIGSQTQKDRQAAILEFVRSNKGVSIKDICNLAGPSVRNCSEKTVQRELTELIRQGLIKKIGERRWSQYLPA